MHVCLRCNRWVHRNILLLVALLLTLYANKRQCKVLTSYVKWTSQEVGGVKRRKARPSFQLS
jgi:hypothetical protein